MRDKRIISNVRIFTVYRSFTAYLLSLISSRSSLIVFLALLISSTPAFAVPLIRDAEIENTLRAYADPIFREAGLNPGSIKLFIVNDDSLNAFVAGGSNMFVNAGLIMATHDPGMLIGVMAHETGHIAGGHLAQGAEKLKNAQLGTILSYVLGAAAAVATKKPEAAAAVITGGSNTIQRQYLAYSRANEEAADQAALKYLDALHISASGLMQVFALLQRNERMHMGNPDPYLLTHPLSSSRIELVRNHVTHSAIPEGAYPAAFEIRHKRMVAKLYSFLNSPEATFQKYPHSDNSVPARLAHAVAYYKMPDLARSMKEMDSLLAESPNDPFFHELKGQILFENGKVTDALTHYRKAVELRPNSPLILTDLAHVELSQPEHPPITSAISHLQKAASLDNSNPNTWHLLAIAYGKAGNLGMSYLSLAEEALLGDDADEAIKQANQAMAILDKHALGRLRAQDIKVLALQMKHDKEGFDSSTQ